MYNCNPNLVVSAGLATTKCNHMLPAVGLGTAL